MTLLDISSTITSPLGGTLDLNQAGVYKLEASAFGERSVSQRKTVAKNPFIEGEYAVAAVKENVVEPVAVFVYAPSPAVLRARVDALTDCLDQVTYTLTFRQDDNTDIWDCQAADYTIRTSHEMRFAVMALVSAQVPRRPKVRHP